MISLLQNELRTGSALHFFDVSVVIPFQEKFTSFKKVLSHNTSYFQQNGIEVVVVLGNLNEEKELLDFIQTYPFINWKVIVNRQDYKLQNFSKIINIGIRNASMKYVIPVLPELKFCTNVIFQLREYLTYYPNYFVIGALTFAASCKKTTPIKKLAYPFESIMVEKRSLEQVGGFDERLNEWEESINNICARLETLGEKKLFIDKVVLIQKKRSSKIAESPKKNSSTKERFQLSYPPKLNPNGNNWGDDFIKISYDWQTDRFSLAACNNYLKQFVNHSELTEDTLKKKRTIVLLTPARNESVLITEFITHMSRFCDGIIFLDDGSTDNTYDLIEGEKVLLKVRKKNFGFDDIGNRNILLDLAYFFNTEWLIYMDVDERFDERHSNLDSLTNQDEFDVLGFKFIHLWNSYNTYNGDFPNSKNGLVKTIRMFRSKGYLQLHSSRTLHFRATPYYKPINTNAPILVLHLGNLKEETRQKKYDFYQEEDKTKEAYDYKYLLDKNCTLKNVHDIQQKDLT